MRNIPYVSYRSGDAVYEVNIYGDPDAPAAIEIGMCGDALSSAQAKSNCVEFLATSRPIRMMWPRSESSTPRTPERS